MLLKYKFYELLNRLFIVLLISKFRKMNSPIKKFEFEK